MGGRDREREVRRDWGRGAKDGRERRREERIRDLRKGLEIWKRNVKEEIR